MQIEDHAGDIISKSRASVGLSADEAARLLGCGLQEYEVFEEEGRLATAVSFGALAARLDLDGDKLTQVYQGWEPAQPDLSRWREIRVLPSAQDGFGVNAFLVWDPGSREAALVDTGFDLSRVHELVSEHGLAVRYLLITHGHQDHVAEVVAFREVYPAAALRASAKSSVAGNVPLEPESLALGQLTIDNYETSGHAVDGVTYVIRGWSGDAPPLALVGDALFAGSMGGAGQALGSAKEMVREHLFGLPDGTLVCPGHGPTTTVGEEKRHNPFFRETGR